MADEHCTSLPAHYERRLGRIDRGWLDETKSDGIQVVSFRDQPESGVVTFATLGLSRYILNMTSGHGVRQELRAIA